MSSNQRQIIGLAKSLTDPETGAPIEFFAVSQLTMYYITGKSQAVLQGWVSKAAKDAGKRAVAHVAVELEGLPEGDATQWAYQVVPASTAAPNDLAGAAPIYD